MGKIVSNDCFVCAFYPVLQVITFGHEVVDYYCVHINKDKLNEFHFTKKNFSSARLLSKFRYILLVIFIFHIYMNMKIIIFSFSGSYTISPKKIVSIYGVIGIVSLGIYFMTDKSTEKHRCTYLQAIQYMLDARQIYGFQSFLSMKYIKNWKKYFNGVKIIFMCYAIYNAFDVFIRCFVTNILELGFVVVLGEFCMVQYHASALANHHSVCKVFTDLFSQIYKTARYLADQRVGKQCSEEYTFDIRYESNCFEKHVANLIRMYNALHSNFRIFADCTAKFIPSVWVCQIMLVILQLYCILSAPFLLNDYMVIVRSIQTYGGLTVCLFFIRQFSQLENRVRCNTFLHCKKITKLNFSIHISDVTQIKTFL